MRKLLALCLLAVAGCGPVTKEELDQRFANIERRLDTIEERQRKLEEQSIRTEARLDSTAENLTRLRLEVEKLKTGEGKHSLSELPKPSQPQPQVRPAEQQPAPTQQQTVAQEQKPDYQKEYEEALRLYDLRQLNQAKERFIEFIRKNPSTPLTDNAYLWLGVVYRDLGELNKAEAVWLTLVEKCRRKELPDCNKAPACMLQLARFYEQRGDQAKATEFYQAILNEYPLSEEADTARKKLGR